VHLLVAGLKETGDPWLPVDIEAVRADILRRGANPPRGHGGVKRAEYLRRRRGDALAVSIMGYIGLRIAECFALQWPMLMERDENGRWQVRQHVTITSRISHHGDPENRTKTTRTRRTPRSQRRPRIIEIDPAVRKEIREWWMACGQPTTGYVLTTDDGQPFKKATMTNWNRNIWSRSVANVGLPPEPPKHLRLSCVSMWLREGWDEGSAAAAAGPGTAVMWRTYHKALTARMSAKTPFDMSEAIATARAEVGTDLRSSFGIAVGAEG
jgi:integrase